MIRKAHQHHCCNDDHLFQPDPRDSEQRKVLKISLGIHGTMFLIAGIGGLVAHSTVILAESVDFLSHVFLLAFSLFAAGHGVRWVARASLFKGLTMLVIGASVLVDAARQLVGSHPPAAETIGVIGALGIAANLVSMTLLKRFGSEDLNMHSSYLCSRNDILNYSAVILTSILIAVTGARWPDTVIGCALSLMILSSAVHVIRRSVQLLRTGGSVQPKTSQARV